MNISAVINALQLIVALLLIGSILMQKRGSGLSSVFGGDSAVYHTKRGAEKIIFYVTIGLSVLFFVLAAINFFLIK